MTDAADGVLRVIGSDVDNDVYVLRPSDIDRARGWHVPALIVVDATDVQPLPLPVLAQLVLLRRRLRAAGGDLVVAASPEVAAVLQANGLHWAVPSAGDITAATETVRRHSAPVR